MGKSRDRGREDMKKKPKKSEKSVQASSVLKEVRPPMIVEVVKRKRKERDEYE